MKLLHLIWENLHGTPSLWTTFQSPLAFTSLWKKKKKKKNPYITLIVLSLAIQLGSCFMTFLLRSTPFSHMLIQKLLANNNFPNSILAWIWNYLTDQSQPVRITSSGSLSQRLQSNTGAPQGTVLAPFLFTFYTSDGRSCEPSCPRIKFADDTLWSVWSRMTMILSTNSSLMGLSTIGIPYLELNVSKTKEMVIEFRTSSSTPSPIVLKLARVVTWSMFPQTSTLAQGRIRGVPGGRAPLQGLKGGSAPLPREILHF